MTATDFDNQTGEATVYRDDHAPGNTSILAIIYRCDGDVVPASWLAWRFGVDPNPPLTTAEVDRLVEALQWARHRPIAIHRIRACWPVTA